MAMSYLHKQTLVILAVCLIGVSATWAYVSDKKSRNVPGQSATITENLQISSGNATSTDWKSAFFPTKKENTDNSNAGNPDTGEETLSDTLTDKFGRDFFTRFMILQQNGLTEDSESVKTVVDQSMDEFIDSAPMPRPFGKSDVVISKDTDRSAQRAYANSVGMAFHLYMPKADAATIATEALETENADMLFGIDIISAGYKSLLDNLLKIPVPETMATKHVNLVNGVNSMLFVSEGVGKIVSDPLQSLVALSIYAESQENLKNALFDLAYHYQSQSIAFENTEPGVLFMQILY